MLKSFLSAVKDNRRNEGKRYKLGDILLFSIFAVLGGAVSYRKIHTFIKGHYDVLNEKFGLKWEKNTCIYCYKKYYHRIICI